MTHTDTSTRLNGRRILLRDWEERDLAPLAAWLRPGHRWQTTDAPYFPPMTTDQIERHIDTIRRQITARALPMPRRSLVIAAGESSSMMGMVSWYWESEETNWPGVGIAIYDSAHWGHGLGFEALGLWTDYLFRSLPQIVRLDLRTWSGNRGMIRLAEKLGYLEEARFRKARVVEGTFYDGMGYGVLREEWEARYPAGFAASVVV